MKESTFLLIFINVIFGLIDIYFAIDIFNKYDLIALKIVIIIDLIIFGLLIFIIFLNEMND